MMCCPACACKPAPAPAPTPDIPWRWIILLVCLLTIGSFIDAEDGDFPYLDPWIEGGDGSIGVERPYEVDGIWYEPIPGDGYEEDGWASWYGAGMTGRPTTSGEIFDENAFTAAHRTLPLPSLVEVDNRENGSRLVVRVNDRGPFESNRIISLSPAAARELGFEREGAAAAVRVRYLGPADQSLVPSSVGPPSSFTQGQVLDFTRGQVLGGGPYYVQVASFREAYRAYALVDQLGGVGRASVMTVELGGYPWTRVLIGPWLDLGEATRAQAAAVEMGFWDARITSGR